MLTDRTVGGAFEVFVKEAFPEWGIDFPLDEDEMRELEGVLDAGEPIGSLTMTSPNGTDWEANYSPG